MKKQTVNKIIKEEKRFSTKKKKSKKRELKNDIKRQQKLF